MSEFRTPSPERCSEVGLGCSQCTEHTASQLAQICKGLQAKTVAQLFVQIYPARGCAPMQAHFVQAYGASAPDQIERRGVKNETVTLRMAAVA